MKELIDDIKNGIFRHVYLLYGEESYLKLLWRDRLQKALIPEENSMNLNIFSGKGISEAAVIDQAETVPFFSDRRVIRLDNTGLFSSQTELLPAYLEQLPDYLVLIFTETEIDKRNRLFKAVSKYGYCAEFKEQSSVTIEKWILQLIGPSGLKIRKSNMDFLISRTGTDMSRVLLETDKLIHYCEGQEEITREAIEKVTTEQPENHIFEMISAVTEKQYRTAMKLYADLLAMKEPPLRILYLVGLQYNRLLMIHELDESGKGAQEMASEIGISPYAVKKHLRLARNLTREQLKTAVENCTLLEEDVKTGRIGDRLAVELAMLNGNGSSLRDVTQSSF